MITETQFQLFFERSMKFEYSSFGPLEYSDCMNAELLKDNADMILLFDKSKEPSYIHWAANDPQIIAQKIENLGGVIRINFVPKDFVPFFEESGFYIWAEFFDFFNNELGKTYTSFNDYNSIQFLQSEDIFIIETISKLCAGQSRGFTGETKEWFYDWMKENDIIIIKKGHEIVGYCCVSIYANGTILWVREIAVNPLYQRKGFGRRLLEQAIFYGIKRGAKRGFLHADKLNKNAISLYNEYGFHAKRDEGEIRMIRY